MDDIQGQQKYLWCIENATHVTRRLSEGKGKYNAPSKPNFSLIDSSILKDTQNIVPERCS